MMKLYFSFLLILILLFFPKMNANSQTERDKAIDITNRYFQPKFNNQFLNFRFAFSAYAIINGGFGFSLSAGSWVDNRGIQPSLNSSLNFYFKGNNIGNAKFYGEIESKIKNPNRWQTTILFSPMLTKRLTPHTGMYDEINPFYFGSSSMVYSNYKNSITIGTTFIGMPKGTYNNIMTARNRSQQLLFIQFHFNNVQLNLYEDYLGFTSFAPFQWLADNRDRYYTGGGNLQVRIANYYKIKLYSEMYTGNSYVDKQEYPDNAYPDTEPNQMICKSKSRSINLKYAYQDPGQQSFNKARNFFSFEALTSAIYERYNPGQTFAYPNFYNATQLFIGRQGGMQNMLQQNLIHNSMSINRDNKNCNQSSSLHQFDYSDNYFPQTLFGIGTIVNY